MATAGLRRFFSGLALAGLLHSTTGTVTATTTTTPTSVPFAPYVFNAGHGGNVTIAVNAPDDAPDDLFFHYSAATNGQWTAFGFGDQMTNSLIFVMYPSADKKNVTVSPRIARGHLMPQETNDVNVTVLAGSGIVDGINVVNAHCTGCRRWPGGSVDVKSSSMPIIWANGPGQDAAIASDDKGLPIRQHSGTPQTGWTLDMTKAAGAGGVPDPLASNNSTADANGSNTTGSTSPSRAPVVIHALLMLVAFVLIFPGGYLILRLFEKVWIHAGIQSLGVLCVLAGMISGIALSISRKISPSINAPHQVLGLVATCLVLITWTLGLVGHRLFQKNGVAGIPTMVHRGVGPTAILLGLANGASGFNFAGRNILIVPYIIVVLFVAIVVMSATFFIRKRKMQTAAMNTPAAHNFQNAYYGGNGGFSGQRHQYPPQHGVPMQTLGHGQTDGLPKQPEVSVQPTGRCS